MPGLGALSSEAFIDNFDGTLEVRFRAQAEMLDERFAKVDQSFAEVRRDIAALQKDMTIVRDGVSILLKR